MRSRAFQPRGNAAAPPNGSAAPAALLLEREAAAPGLETTFEPCEATLENAAKGLAQHKSHLENMQANFENARSGGVDSSMIETLTQAQTEKYQQTWEDCRSQGEVLPEERRKRLPAFCK